ncbi:hypothetical protein UB46_25950 [Burkholderiaceae bacterium 16]|nr:hypothetical protein UB46_25950 [Burkholderiaceae bacterium 16]
MRDALAALRTAAVKQHVAATGPAHALALRRVRLRGLAAGAFGGGLAVVAAWLVTVLLMAPAPLPAPATTGLQAVTVQRPETAAAEVQNLPAARDPVAPLPAELGSHEPEPVAVPHPVVVAKSGRPMAGERGATATAASPVTPAANAATRRQPYAAPVRFVPSASGNDSQTQPRSEAADLPASGAPDIDLRPSAVAFVPPDMRFELHGHARLTDD